ncbi:MAG TPA: MlaD family protein [Planctomycetota bacterium]|nr:MlaD family protein [Planctomycetota bacterium]
MSTTANHWKLGLFVVAGVLLGFGTLLWLGRARLHRQVRPLVTFVDEAVQGLEIGAPLKFRGVTVGAVKALRIGPDRRRIEIEMNVFVDVVERLGISTEEAREIRARRDIRLQIASSGITGVKYVLMDYFDPVRFPPPNLPFETPENYVPSTPSTMKSLETGLTDSLEKLPPAIERASTVLASLDATIVDLDVKGLRKRIDGTLERIDAAIVDADVKKLSGGVEVALTSLRETLDELRRVAHSFDARTEGLQPLVARVDSATATIEAAIREARVGDTTASLRGATDGVADVSAVASSVQAELGSTFVNLRDAAASLRSLLRMLERDPQSPLFGKTPETPSR